LSSFVCLVKSAEKIAEIYKEAKLLKSLKHKNIIKLDQAFLHKSDLVLVMEVADGGELKDLVKQKQGIDEMRVREITR